MGFGARIEFGSQETGGQYVPLHMYDTWQMGRKEQLGCKRVYHNFRVNRAVSTKSSVSTAVLALVSGQGCPLKRDRLLLASYPTLKTQQAARSNRRRKQQGGVAQVPRRVAWERKIP